MNEPLRDPFWEADLATFTSNLMSLEGKIAQQQVVRDRTLAAANITASARDFIVGQIDERIRLFQRQAEQLAARVSKSESELPLQSRVPEAEPIGTRDTFKLEKRCVRCGMEAGHQCTICRNVRYCGKSCWLKDRELHKSECKRG